MPLNEFIDAFDGHSVFQFPLNPDWFQSDGFGKITADGDILACEFAIAPGTMRVIIDSTYLGEDETVNDAIEKVAVPLYREQKKTSDSILGFVWLERKLPPHFQKQAEV